MLGLRDVSTGRIHPLLFPKVSFGKDSARCDIALVSPAAARRHFEISLSDNGRSAHLVDLGSADGTILNGERLLDEASRRLEVNDHISVANQEDFIVVECGIANEAIERSREKLMRLRTECERIRAKEGFDGLSMSQQRTLEKYEADIKRLVQTVVDAVNGIVSKVTTADGDGEDEVYWGVNVAEDDGTSNAFRDLTDKKQLNLSKVETYESLTKKMAELDTECARLENQIQVLEQEQSAANDDEEDELEKFMAANEETIKSSDLEKAQRKLKIAKDERERCRALAEIARPALYRGTSNSNQNTVATLLPATTVPATQSVAPQASTTKTGISAFAPVKSKVDDIFARSSAPTARPAAAKLRVVQQKVEPDDNFEGDPKRHKSSEPEPTDQERDPVWRPPSNQKGDGKTKVNERFGY